MILHPQTDNTLDRLARRFRCASHPAPANEDEEYFARLAAALARQSEGDD